MISRKQSNDRDPLFFFTSLLCSGGLRSVSFEMTNFGLLSKLTRKGIRKDAACDAAGRMQRKTHLSVPVVMEYVNGDDEATFERQLP